MDESTVDKWFARFQRGNLSGRPRTFLKACIQLWWPNWSADKNDPGYTEHCRDASYISYESPWYMGALWCNRRKNAKKKIVYNNEEWKSSLGKWKACLYRLIGLEGYCSVRTLSANSNVEFRKILFLIISSKISNRWKSSRIG